MQDSNLTFFNKFPEHFKVGSVEHLVNLSSAVLKNLLGTRIHWDSTGSYPLTTKTDKASSKDFLRLWSGDSTQVHYTQYMLDVLHISEKPSKRVPKANDSDIEIELHSSS